MLIELHCHTSRHSPCSQLPPDLAVREAAQQGLHGLLLTEHGYWWPDAELAELRARAGVPEHFILLAGQEVDTELGHLIVIGAGLSLPGRYQAADLQQRFPDAALIRAHPFRHGSVPGDPGLRHPALAAIEIFNRNQYPAENIAALRAWHRLRFTATAGSDAHLPGQVGSFPTLLDHPVRTLPELAAEIRAGRCRPLCKEIAKSGGNLTVTELIIGAKGGDETRPRLILKEFAEVPAWEKAQAAAMLMELLGRKVFSDGAYRVPRVLAVNDRERYLIEESQRGKTLFALLGTVAPGTGADYLRLAAGWLARLHQLPCPGTPFASALREARRFASYRAALARTRNPQADRAAKLIDRVAAGVAERLAAGPRVRCHGDYHPQNIILGQDLAGDPETRYVSVIDFANTLTAPRAHDLGYFLAQLAYQGGRHHFRDRYPDGLFVDAYGEAAGVAPAALAADIAFYRARANLSIANYLIKVGMGESVDLTRLLDDTERLLGFA